MFMAHILQPWPLLHLFFVFFYCLVHFSTCQPNPQNIETFYPFELPPQVLPTPNTPSSPPQSSFSTPPPLPPPPPRPPPPKSSSNKSIVKAVAITAVSTLVLVGLLFFLFNRCIGSQRRRVEANTAVYRSDPAVVPSNDFSRDGNIKGLIVDENGLDVLYWKKLEGRNRKNSFRKEVLQNSLFQDGKEKKMERRGSNRLRKTEPIQEIPLLRVKSSTSHNPYQLEVEDPYPIPSKGKSESLIQSLAPSPPSTLPLPPGLLPISKKQNPAPSSPPPPILTNKNPAPPPLPPPILAKKNPAPPPPPPPILAKKNPAPPPPPPKAGGLALSSKPPLVPKGMPGDSNLVKSLSREGMAGTDVNGQVKLKPLHWDKVNANNVDHSMVWDKVNGGSFRFDGDLMEALFGSVASNRKSPPRSNANSGPPAQIFILDTRKSQNTAIVLKSLAISRKEILDALIEGHGLNADSLEKLNRIAPTKEEESQILAFDGDHTRLADAESFLYHLLKAVPSAFSRLNAMLFRLTYDSEIISLKQTLQILELGCQELRTRGLFLRLLEAILKAGNRMNAGTSRGNAKAFNLTSLRKLSDVKSTDGKTTLLHFVVEEVVRSEGKRCVLNRNHSLSHSSSQSSSILSDNSTSREDREKEYTMLGLPIIGGLSAQFSNVKKAATIDQNAFSGTCKALMARVAENREIVAELANKGGGFVMHMKGFLEAAEEELKSVRHEQTRVIELVKRTTQYYQAGGASNDKEANPLQLFVIVKDFLGMVDQVCIDIARNLQKRKTVVKASVGSSQSPALRNQIKFPNLPEHFMSQTSDDSE